MSGRKLEATPRAAAMGLVLVLAAAGCQSGASPSASAPASAAAIEPIYAQDAVDAVEALPGDFSCADARPRADDYAWVCEGSRGSVAATVHLYATAVQGPLFGATLYTSSSAGGQSEAAGATRQLALDLVGAVVPAPWREAASGWLDEHLPDGGRTLDVPGAGITASVQPLAALQWYVELYELDGLQGQG